MLQPERTALVRYGPGGRPAFSHGLCGGGHGTDDPPPATIRLTYRDWQDNVLAIEDVCQRCADGIARPWAHQSKPLIRR